MEQARCQQCGVYLAKGTKGLCEVCKKQKGESDDQNAVVEREIDDPANHGPLPYCSAVFCNTSAFCTTRRPGAIPEMISCMFPGSMAPAVTSSRRN